MFPRIGVSRRWMVAGLICLAALGGTVLAPAEAGIGGFIRGIVKPPNPFDEGKRILNRHKREAQAVKKLPKHPVQAARELTEVQADKAIGDTRIPEGIQTYVDNVIYRQAAPLPPDGQNQLLMLANSGRAPFSTRDVIQTRWIHRNAVSAKYLFPGTYGGNNPAITYGRLIIVDDAFLSYIGIERIAKWAHEVVHVSDY